MGVTWSKLFKPGITLQYPLERWEMPDRSRNRLFNKIEDCIGCGQCLRACPVDCIFIETEKREKDEPELFASDGTAIKLRTTRFDIDMTLCCYCSLCVYPCPTHCLVMTDEYEYSTYNKDGMLYRFATDAPREAWTDEEKEAYLLSAEELAEIEAEEKRKKEEAARKKAEAAAKKAEAAKKAAEKPKEE
jgi:formate hydrogenlyase subunit 6/NADH:ubiquinone oxidoreductase subunit I